MIIFTVMSMDIEYKIKLYDHFREIFSVLGFLVLGPMGLFLAIYMHSSNIDKSLLYSGVVLIIGFFLTLPTFIVHKNYWNCNKGDSLKLDFENKNLRFRHNNLEIDHSFQDIKYIDIYKTYESKNLSFATWENYGHMIIHLKNGQSFIITSLLYPYECASYMSDNIKTYTSFYRSGFGLKHNL